MLDAFLEVAYQQQKTAEVRAELVEGFMQLPIEELRSIAEGETKLAFGDDDDWLEKYKGTELYPEALQLEQECLEAKIQQEQRRLAEQSERDEQSEQRDSEYKMLDAVRLKKRILDLKLNQMELQALGAEGGAELGAEGMEGAEGQEEAVVPDAQAEPPAEEAAADNAGVASVEKAAAVMLLTKFAAPAPKKMDPARARDIVNLEGEAEWNAAGEDTKAEGVEALNQALAEERQRLSGAAEYAAEHPVLNRLKGAVAPGVMGSGIGFGAGLAAAKTPRQLLTRGLIGAGVGAAGLGGLGAALTPGAGKRQQEADEYAAAEQSITPGARQKAVREALAPYQPVPGEDPQQHSYVGQSLDKAEAVGREVGLKGGGLAGGLMGLGSGMAGGKGVGGIVGRGALGAAAGGLLGGAAGGSAMRTLMSPHISRQHEEASLKPRMAKVAGASIEGVKTAAPVRASEINEAVAQMQEARKPAMPHTRAGLAAGALLGGGAGALLGPRIGAGRVGSALFGAGLGAFPGAAAGYRLGKRNIDQPTMDAAKARVGELMGRFESEGVAPDAKPSVKKAAAKIRTELQKEAIAPVLQAAGAGLKGAGQYLRAAAGATANAAKAGGLSHGLRVGKATAGVAGRKAKRFAAANPAAAGLIGAGGVGAAGLASQAT